MNDDETTLPQPPKVAKPAGAAKKQVDYVVTISRTTDRYDLMGLGLRNRRASSPTRPESSRSRRRSPMVPGSAPTMCNTAR